MWIISAIIIHLLLLGSIFVIYFRSPVLRGLRPQDAVIIPPGEEPPAKRLVLIVTDGLRAESFFKNACGDIPFIRKLIQTQGMVGISQTHVPTESRPGHIALIAGLYEDPSAVTRGWKENPIDFDNVFNRSARTYAWGANDVLHIFSRITSEQRMFIDAYDHDLDFSGREKTYELDEWVFKKVRFFLNRKAEELLAQQEAIYFLHLLGLDSAGHIHKPDSDLFLKNLHSTDEGIYEIYNQFQKTFPDNKTAFILTSDHGMTNSGNLNLTFTP